RGSAPIRRAASSAPGCPVRRKRRPRCAACARTGRGAPSIRRKAPARVRAKAERPAPRPSRGSAGAAVTLLGAGGAILDQRRGARELRGELLEGGAGIGLPPGLAERHAELQEIVRRLGALRVFLIALGEGDGRVLVVAL